MCALYIVNGLLQTEDFSTISIASFSTLNLFRGVLWVRGSDQAIQCLLRAILVTESPSSYIINRLSLYIWQSIFLKWICPLGLNLKQVAPLFKLKLALKSFATGSGRSHQVKSIDQPV